MFKSKMNDRAKNSSIPNQMEDPQVGVSLDEKPFEFGFGLEIDNIKTMKYDEPVYSHPCIVYGLMWKIMIRKNKRNETLGFFLHCKPGSNKQIQFWDCYATVTFTIVNRKNSSNNLSRETRHLFSEREFDWGFMSFHSLNEFYNSNLVSSNSVKFQVSVSAHLPTFGEMNDKDSENVVIDLLTSNLRTELNSFKTDLRRDFAEMNLLPTNLRTEMSLFKTDFRKDFVKMNSLLAKNLEAEMSSFKTDFHKNLAEMMKEIRSDVIAQIKSEVGKGVTKICSGQEKRVAEKKITNVEFPETRKNVMAQVDIAVEERPERIREGNKGRKVSTVVKKSSHRIKVPKVEAVVEKSPEKVEEANKIKVDAKVIEVPKSLIEDNETVSADKGGKINEVVPAEPENSIDDFEIVSQVESKKICSKNSDTSFEMISKDTDDDRPHCVFEETAKSNFVINIVEEYFANGNDDHLAIIPDLTYLDDSPLDDF